MDFDPEKTIDAVWTVDSETGDEVLIDRITNLIIARRGKIINKKKASFDYCALFAAIEADPHAPVQMTVGQSIGASEHIRVCQECMDRVNRVVEAHPDCGNDSGVFMSEN